MLRQMLQTMVEVQDVAQHPIILAELTRDYPNSIRIADSEHSIRRYTCLMHVFDFTEKPEYLANSGHGCGPIFAGADFAHWLIEIGRLVEVSQPENDDLVFYFSEGHFKHAGLFRANCRILSKWGIGYLYDHELLEVPASFGTDIRFYKRLSYEHTEALFALFAMNEHIRLRNAAP